MNSLLEKSAYARPTVPGVLSGGNEWGSPGLTNRELFSAMAMQAIVTSASMDRTILNVAVIADEAVCCADALIAALAKEIA